MTISGALYLFLPMPQVILYLDYEQNVVLDNMGSPLLISYRSVLLRRIYLYKHNGTQFILIHYPRLIRKAMAGLISSLASVCVCLSVHKSFTKITQERNL